MKGLQAEPRAWSPTRAESADYAHQAEVGPALSPTSLDPTETLAKGAQLCRGKVGLSQFTAQLQELAF